MKHTNKSSRFSNKKRKYDPRPLSFVEKFNFLKAVILSKDLTALDHKICLIISERYKDLYGNSEASLTYLEVGTGASHQGVVKSLKRLKKHNVIVIDEGRAGSRSTRYRPNLDFAVSQQEGTGTSQPALTTGSGEQALTSREQPELTSRGSTSQPELTESHLRNPPTAEVTLSGQTAPAAGAGLAAAPREGVDRLEVEIVAAALSPRDNGDQCLTVDMKMPDDEIWSDEFILHSDDQGRQDAGWKRYGKLTAALDFIPDEAEALIGRRVVLLDDRRLTSFGYAPLLCELTA